MNQRRSFLKSSVVLASAIGMPALAKAAQPAPAERTLRLYNTHTGESLRSVFWAEGQFIPDALKDINKLLRDHRNDKIAEMERATTDLSSMQTQITTYLKDVKRLGEELSAKRAAVAKKLGPLVVKALADLGMEKATFTVTLAPAAGTIPGESLPATPSGFDACEFIAQTNPGQLAQPLGAGWLGGGDGGHGSDAPSSALPTSVLVRFAGLRPPLAARQTAGQQAEERQPERPVARRALPGAVAGLAGAQVLVAAVRAVERGRALAHDSAPSSALATQRANRSPGSRWSR